MGVNEKILEAIGICADDIVKKAGYNKTIQAQIMSCQDATIGKYKCKFQDAIFYAYNTNTEVSYTKGTTVYILIPSNDMGKEKIILGATKRLGINYISQASEDQAYQLVGQNCINNNNIYYLNTSIQQYSYDIYNYDRDGKDNAPFDIQTVEYNLKQSSSMLIGATIKTNIDATRQHNGHYGIAYTLVFQDNVYSREVKRTYILDEDGMVSNPYKLVLNTRQFQVFNIDGDNFVRIDSIKIFNADFPDATDEQPEEGDKPIESGDIILSKFQLYGANALSEQEINGIAITFYTPQGNFFTKNQDDIQKTIIAQVRIKGKLASSAQNIPFFWGRQNIKVNTKSDKYNKYLGRGWECLNSYNQIADDIIQWVPHNDTFVLKREDAPAANNRLKVAILYNENVITKVINIKNLGDRVLNITIQSDEGTEFHHDIGHPTLTCSVGEDNQNNNYEYYWSYVAADGNEELPETSALNQEYEDAVNRLAALKEKQLTVQYASELQQAEEAVQRYDYLQRVQKNKIYNVQIRQITNFRTFKCSVFNGEQYLGTGEITLTNKLQSQDLYSLVINNGSAVYQYNENGVAPNNKSLQNPQIIPALTFSLYDDNGVLVDSQSLIQSKNCQVTWKVPKENTLLIKPLNIEKTSEDDNFYYYKNVLNLTYDIATKYNINCQNNQIILNVKYKEKDVTSRTNFTFTKQGQPGTNGTQYIVKIVPNTMMNNPPLYPMVTTIIDSKGGKSYHLNYGIGNDDHQTSIGNNALQYFNIQLWRNGELVDLNDPAYTVVWDILKNKNEISNFELNNNGKITFKQKNADNLSNIIKCSVTVKDTEKTYYGTIPIITATVNENYQVQLKDNSGFRYVLYSSDGVSPQYDSANPFEIICKQKIGNNWEDISNISGNDDESAEYKLSYIFDAASSWPNLLNRITRRNTQNNQQWYRPIEEFNGYCTDAAVTCKITQGNEDNIVATIRIPVHFLLNKYGLSHLNDWDGNSIQINEDGGYILAPQMGAGVKNNDNTFTGVLMGEMIQPNSKRIDIGLMGFGQGERSFFIDSQSGAALFGKKGGNKKKGGGIAIDPNAAEDEDALLYSHNFFKEYNEKGFPEKYNYRDSKFKPTGNGNGQGMIINLSRPQIYFGSGNFYVTSDGYIHASGGGDIAGWNIKDDRLYTTDGKGRNILTLQSSSFSPIYQQGKIFSNTHNSLVSTVNGFYLSDDGLSIGSKVKIDQSGVMKLGAGAVADAPNNKYWTIDGSKGNSFISYGTKGESNSVYLGTDSISLGNTFSVTNNGYLVAASGTVGGWEISNSTIKSKGSDNNNLILHNTGWIEGSGWRINSSGFYSGSDNSGQGFSDSGFKLNGSSLTSPGGIINSSGSGCLGGTSLTTSPLTWTPSSVTLRGKTEIVNGAKIGNFEIKNNNILGKGNSTQITVDDISVDNLKVSKSFSFEQPNGTSNSVSLNNLKSGVATFSDGSTMTFRFGMLIGIKLGEGATWTSA